MISYADASSLLKLYVEEPGSDAARAHAEAARIVTASVVAYVEVRAGLARAAAMGRISAVRHEESREEFEDRWRSMFTIDLSVPVWRHAADLAEAHRLRSIDAIHLASALFVRDRTREPVTLSAWDSDLVAAAAAEGLATF